MDIDVLLLCVIKITKQETELGDHAVRKGCFIETYQYTYI